MLGTSLQATLQSAAPNIWIGPSPKRGKVQLRSTPCMLLCTTAATRTLGHRLPSREGDMSFSTRCCSCFPHLTTRLNLPVFRSANTSQHNSLTWQHQLCQQSPFLFLFQPISWHPALSQEHRCSPATREAG